MNIVLAAALAGLASATPTPSPGAVHHATAAMAISVSDGVTSVTDGDELTYTISLRNDGAAGSGRLAIRFQPPTGAKLTTVDHHGASVDDVATWSVDVPPGAALKLTVGTTVGSLPAGVNGVAGIACIIHGSTPSLCATDMNQIAGRSDIHATVVAAQPAHGGRSLSPWVAIGGATGAIVFLGAGGLLLVRRRLRRQPAPTR
jgi:hypothetical protein